MWGMLYPKEYKDPKFAVGPGLTAPYKAGALAPETIEEALKVTKLYRYLSGLSWQTLSVNAADCAKAQHGAVILQKIGSLTHEPIKPEDMDEGFFKLAFAGCHESNLHQGQGNVVDGIRGFMDDSDQSNIDRVGHRRWVLYPPLKQVGFGYANGFVSMHVIEKMVLKKADMPAPFNPAVFPGEGYYPRQLIGAHYAWSAHFCLARVALPDVGSVAVKVWKLDEHFGPVEEVQTKVINVAQDGAQVEATLIFQPEFKAEGRMSLAEAGRYWVRIDGLRTVKGAAMPFEYIVDLIDLPTTYERPAMVLFRPPARVGVN